MFSLHSVRDCCLYPFAGLRFAADGAEIDRPAPPMSLFADTDQPQPTPESQVVDLYDQLRPSLLAYLGALGLALSEAEDVIHDCFIRLFDHLARKEHNQNLRGWLFRVAHNLAMDQFREDRRIQHTDADGVDLLELIVDSSLSPEERAIRSEEIRRLRSALDRLTPQQRSAVLLRAEELRFREIGDILGVSTKRVSELVQRALARLAGDL